MVAGFRPFVCAAVQLEPTGAAPEGFMIVLSDSTPVLGVTVGLTVGVVVGEGDCDGPFEPPADGVPFDDSVAATTMIAMITTRMPPTTRRPRLVPEDFRGGRPGRNGTGCPGGP